jgi:protein SCO1/2
MEICVKRSLSRSLSTALVTGVIALSLSSAPACAHDAESHAHHQHAARETTRSIVEYAIPAVNLVRDDGKTVELSRELNDGRPVVLNFIYTTCTSVCPLTSQTFADLQSRLGAARTRVHLVSISIDPEQDTPARLKAYAEKFSAGPDWRHYTGTLAASITAQRAFNAYRGGKMNHAPVTLVRLPSSNRWIRIDGFATAEQLLGELHDTVATR